MVSLAIANFASEVWACGQHWRIQDGEGKAHVKNVVQHHIERVALRQARRKHGARFHLGA